MVPFVRNAAAPVQDLSASVMDRALMHSDCVYNIPNVRVVGRLCKTNQASNTAFRGFGGPQVRTLKVIGKVWSLGTW